MKKLIALSILIIFGFLLVSDAPHSQSLGTPSVTPKLAGAATVVDKVWFNSTGTLTDQTAAANSPTPGGVNLGGNLGDSHIVGEAGSRFTTIFYNISPGTDRSGGVNWQYWNGVAWKSLAIIKDDTNNFTNSGFHFVNFTAPSDWANSTIPAKPPRLAFTAFYVRALTVTPYVFPGLPLSGQMTLVLVPRPSPPVRVTVTFWNNTDVVDANVGVWNATAAPAVLLKSHSSSTSGGLYIFNATEVNLKTGQTFFFRVFRVGYATTNSTNLLYNATSTVPIEPRQPLILHATLQVKVSKQPNPTLGIPFVIGRATNQSTIILNAIGNATGTIEFGINATKYPTVNVTIGSPGWITGFSRDISIKPGTTTLVTMSLSTTIRMRVISELNYTVPLATVTVRDRTGSIVGSASDNSTSDQDGLPNGIVNFAMNPALVANPVSITVTRPGFSSWTQSLLDLNSTKQLSLNATGLLYNLHVQAWDQLNNALTLTSSDTNFTSTGLSISQYNFSKNTGYVAADPLTTGRLTIVRTGYVSTSTGSFTPPLLRNQAVLNITYKQGGTGPGLLFTVKVVGVLNELGSPFQIGTNATITSSMGPPTSNVYFAAASNITVTAFASGYVSASILVTPSSSSQTTTLFQAPGLRFTIKVVAVYDELGNKFQIGTNATITASSGKLILVAGSAYLNASSTVSLTASAMGYVTTTATLTPSMSSQTTVTFGPSGSVPGLPFTVKVVGIADQLGNTLASATVSAPGVTPVLKAGVFYFALAPSTSVNLVAAASGYVNTTAPLTPTSTFQSTVTFGTPGSSATVPAPGLPFTLNVRVIQSWDNSPVQGAAVSIYSDSAFSKLLASATTDSSGNFYQPANPTIVYVQVSMTGYATYKGPALQLSAAQQTTSSVSFTAKTSTISASGTTVSVIANTNISGLSFDSTSNTISLTSTSPSAGNLNVTIPQSLIPTGATIKVTSGGQTFTYTTTQDANNIYLRIPTTSGTSNLQVAFPAPSASPSQSLLITIVIAVVVVAAVGVVTYAVLRRRKTALQPKAK